MLSALDGQYEWQNDKVTDNAIVEGHILPIIVESEVTGLVNVELILIGIYWVHWCLSVQFSNPVISKCC